ncbi:MAG: phosphatidylglycerol lysyltransferase domain-containing protein [Acidobacteriaceae bacterium]
MPTANNIKKFRDKIYSFGHVIVSAVVFSSGLLILIDLEFGRFIQRHQRLQELFSSRTFHLSRLLSLVLAVVLIYLSFNLFRRKQNAWRLAFGATSVQIILLLRHRIHWVPLAVFGVALLVLWGFRGRFTAKTGYASIKQGVVRSLALFFLAIVYGTVGFDFLEERDFGTEFGIGRSVIKTLQTYASLGNPGIEPLTRHAAWFIDSLKVMGLLTLGLIIYSLFRPWQYRFRTLPYERSLAHSILLSNPKYQLGYFQLLPDKNYFFLERKGFISYRVFRDTAMVLGDPVVSEEGDAAELISSFVGYSRDNGWIPMFYQTTGRFLAELRKAGMKTVKIGEEAVVDIEQFIGTVAVNKYFRKIQRKLKDEGFIFKAYEPPLSEEVLAEADRVSREWLSERNRKERGFAVGQFNKNDLAHQRLFVIEHQGKIEAFANEVPSFMKGEAQIDLMRFARTAPKGAMDFLFLNLIVHFWQKGFKTFNLGLAPLAGLGQGEESPLLEKGLAQIYNYLNGIFAFKGLREYKSKFKPLWQDRFLAYPGLPVNLIKAGLALQNVSKS